MKNSRRIFTSHLPAPSTFGGEAFLIYDLNLEKRDPACRSWIRSFPVRYGVRAGEDLKAVENFPSHLLRISEKARELSSRQMSFVVLGGGSVGDFGGFVASIFKRGVRLVHIPSTWLAAIDSAHGGKTALNVHRVKNQIGTFYPAEEIYLIASLLRAQPEIRAHEAFAEAYKAALLAGGPFWKKFSSLPPSGKNLWHFLPAMIELKYRIVKKDPFERSGHRHLLNLGHTMGHVFESLFDIPHGIAVNYGLRFALEWSAQRGLMSPKTYRQLDAAKATGYLLSPAQDGFLDKRFHSRIERLLQGDKKKVVGGKIRFIFCAAPGKCLIREVTVAEIMREVQRQCRL